MTATIGGERRDLLSVRNLVRLIDLATQSHARAAIVLVVAALLSILPGFFSIPPTDRDEARFAQATKQMIETGDYVDIRFQDEVRYKKPVGIYWLQAAVVKTADAVGVPDALTTISLYRIPSLLGAIGAVLLTYWAALAFVSQRAALLAGLMMASCFVLSVEGRIAKTDAALLATIVAALGALARAYLPEQRKRLAISPWTVPAIFWSAVGLGILLKGPVIALFVGLCVATLVIVDRSARWLLALKPLPGVLLVALLVLPWFLAIILRSGDSFFAESIGKDLLSKVAVGQESHGAPPGYYFLFYWVTFFPAATLTSSAIPAIWAARREPGAKFLLSWIVPAWILLELIVTKLPHYIMPIYPAIAILIAGIIDARMMSKKRWLVNGTLWWFVVTLLGGIAGLVLLLFVGRQFGFLVWPAVGAAIVMGLLAWRLYEADGPEHSMLRAVAATILLTFALFGLVVPVLSHAFPSAALAKQIREAAGCANPVVASVGYHEPSLVFLLGTSTRLADVAGAVEFLGGGQCRFALVESRYERGFARRAESVGLVYAPVAKVEGFNVGNGRSISVSVFRPGSPP